MSGFLSNRSVYQAIWLLLILNNAIPHFIYPQISANPQLFIFNTQNFSRFRGLSINDENKKGFRSVGRAANEERRGSVGTFYSARSLVTFFPLDFGERLLAEMDKTSKGHFVKAHFLQGYNFNPWVTLKWDLKGREFVTKMLHRKIHFNIKKNITQCKLKSRFFEM